MEEKYAKKILNEMEQDKEKIFDKNGTLNLVTKLRKSMLQLVGEYISEKDGAVDYISLLQSDDYKNFLSLCKELHFCNIAELSDEEKKAFFINVYNVLTIHAISDYHKDVKDRSSFKSTLDIPFLWKRFCYNIGGCVFSLDDIEHGVLRCNAAHPTTEEIMFQPNDPRLQFKVSLLDPRIHFALNCGAKSCPAVSVYSAENLDQTLDRVTKGYLEQELKIERSSEGKVVLLPQILEWYGRDFASNEQDVLRWITKYLSEGLKDEIESMYSEGNGQPVIKYFYDWRLNQGAQ